MAEIADFGSGTASGSKLAHYHIDNCLLKYQSRIVISPNSTGKLKLLAEHHSTLAVGHQYVLKTYHRLKRGFYWPCMKGDIKTYISKCNTCQQNKYETLSPPGLLQPFPIPQKIWTDISIDFIMGLPSCKGKTVIFVIVDMLTKYAHFLALAHPYTAITVAQLFVDNIFKLHGMPSTIVSDRDSLFLSSFLKGFFKLYKSQLWMQISSSSILDDFAPTKQLTP
ncbi:hypothetical protein ACFX2I_005733 [Malus domestica]